MACPYFEPGERLPLSSGSLGDLYAGRCNVAPEVSQPDTETVADRCNLGYARGRCSHFPPGAGPDAVRFSVMRHGGDAIQILYSIERNHSPFSNGALEYSTQAGAFTSAPEDVAKLAKAYVRSYLRRSRQ